MILELAPEAEQELASARAYYEAEREGLGDEFLQEMEAVADRIAALPNRFPIIRGTEMRRALGRRFPFMLVFKVRGEVVRILAVAHQHREPGYWRTRS